MCFKLTRLAAADQPATLAAAGAAADGARRRLDRRGRSRALEQRVFVEGVLYIHHVAQPSVVIAVQFCIHLIDLVGREDRDLRTDVVLMMPPMLDAVTLLAPQSTPLATIAPGRPLWRPRMTCLPPGARSFWYWM